MVTFPPDARTALFHFPPIMLYMHTRAILNREIDPPREGSFLKKEFLGCFVSQETPGKVVSNGLSGRGLSVWD